MQCWGTAQPPLKAPLDEQRPLLTFSSIMLFGGGPGTGGRDVWVWKITQGVFSPMQKRRIGLRILGSFEVRVLEASSDVSP